MSENFYDLYEQNAYLIRKCHNNCIRSEWETDIFGSKHWQRMQELQVIWARNEIKWKYEGLKLDHRPIPDLRKAGLRISRLVGHKVLDPGREFCLVKF